MRVRLIGGFLSMAAIAMAIGIVGNVNLGAMRQADQDLYQYDTVPQPELAYISVTSQKIRTALRDFLAAPMPQQKKDFRGQIRELTRSLDKAINDYDESNLSRDERALFDQFLQARGDYRDFENRILAAGQAGRPQDGWAILWSDGYGKTAKTVLGALAVIEQMKVADAHKAQADNLALARGGETVMLIAIGLGVLLALGAGAWLTNSITGPVGEMVEVLRFVAAGDLTKRVEIHSEDEIGQMAKTLNWTVDELQAARSQLIDAREEAQQRVVELKESEGRARTYAETVRKVLEASPDPVSITRFSDGTVIRLVDTTYAGYTWKEVAGKSTYRVGMWAEKEQYKRYIAKINEHGRVTNMEVTFRRKDGVEFPCLLSSTVVELNGEKCIVSFTRDISRIKEAERKIREREATLRKIIDASPDPITINRLDDGAFIDVNRAFEEAVGLTRAEVLNRPSLRLGPAMNRKGSAEFEAMLGGGAARNLEVEFTDTNGRVIPTLMSAAIAEIDGTSCVVAISRDITKLKESENQLRAAREEAEAASRAKSEFLSSMSHEIRTPMNAVLGMCELLSETELNREQRRYVEVMSSNGATLLDLINDILDLAKMESGRLQVESTEFDFTDLIERTLATFATGAHGKGLELAARIAPGVPDHLVGDPLRLRQILVNLLGNAIKFTELGEVTVTIEHDPETNDPGSLKFTVADTGIGIAADKLQSIFSEFVQADSSTTRKYGGSGLGLAIVYRLVGLLGGRIWVESEPRKGSKFIFTTKFGLATRTITAIHQGLPDLTGMRVLVVDDNATNREIAREMVTSVGAKVAEADCGEAALAAVREAIKARLPFRLMLLDMRMPGMDGFEVATAIRREIIHDAPLILMLSSDDLAPQLSRLRGANLDAYLVKPITRRELFQAIAKVLAEDRAVRVVDAAQPAPPEPAPPHEPLAAHILVAEDSPDNRLLIAAYLRRTQCKIDFAENGQLAVGKFTNNHYDLVLMDIQMPVMDGYAATRAIRAWESKQGLPRTSVLALTASVFEEAVKKTREAGCDAHISKPVKKATLLEAIHKYAVHPAPLAEPTDSAAEPLQNEPQA